MTTPPNAAPPGTPLLPRAVRLAAALESWPRRTITIKEVWELFAVADPAWAARPTRRTDLAEAITALAAVGLVSCSKNRDMSAAPPLPSRLTMPAPAPSPTAAAMARAIAWRPELAWAASARLTVGQVDILKAVNTWLRDRGDDNDVAPLRERSLEVLGHEKRLDVLLGTTLFAPGRLTLDLLRTFRAHPPLPVRRLGTGPVLLVVENSDTFDTMLRTLTPQPGPVGRIAWGAGGAFEASVVSVADLDGVQRIAYYGDLDADGLRIPTNAAATARNNGLPDVVPAVCLYRLLLNVGTPQPGQPQVPDEQAAALTGWLPPSLASAAADLLRTGCRLAQEATGRRQLDATPDWREGLDVPP